MLSGHCLSSGGGSWVVLRQSRSAEAVSHHVSLAWEAAALAVFVVARTIVVREWLLQVMVEMEVSEGVDLRKDNPRAVERVAAFLADTEAAVEVAGRSASVDAPSSEAGPTTAQSSTVAETVLQVPTAMHNAEVRSRDLEAVETDRRKAADVVTAKEEAEDRARDESWAA